MYKIYVLTKLKHVKESDRIRTRTNRYFSSLMILLLKFPMGIGLAFTSQKSGPNWNNLSILHAPSYVLSLLISNNKARRKMKWQCDWLVFYFVYWLIMYGNCMLYYSFYSTSQDYFHFLSKLVQLPIHNTTWRETLNLFKFLTPTLLLLLAQVVKSTWREGIQPVK